MNRSARMKCVGLYRSGLGFESPDVQVDSIVGLSQENNLELLNVNDLGMRDHDKNSLIMSALDQNADCIMVWRLDCLSPFFKNLEDIISFLASLVERRITFISVQDKIDTDLPTAQVLVRLNAAWIELKSNRKIENGRRSAMKAKVNGNKPGPQKKRNDQKIFELRGEGLSIRKIANELGLSPGLVHRVLKKMPKNTTIPAETLPTEV